MASDGTVLLRTVLSEEEYFSISEIIRSKLATHLEEKLEEFLTSKAVFESSKNRLEQKSSGLENELLKCEAECKRLTDLATENEALLSQYQSKAAEYKDNLDTLNTTADKLQNENSELRKSRNEAADERDTLSKMLERRNAELERLHSEVKTLHAELQSAVNSKYEALAQVEEIKAKESSLDFREKSMEQDREFLTQKVKSLSEERENYVSEIGNMRREHALRLVTLQTQLAGKTEELSISLEKEQHLRAVNADLTSRVEELAAKIMTLREEESTVAENYHQEIQAKTKLADIYKRMNEDLNAKNEDFEDAVRNMQRLVEDTNQQYQTLEQSFKEAEAAHESVLENKNACIAALKQELKDANQLIESIKQQNLEKAIEVMSPAAAAASKLMKSGLTLTQIYTQYVSVEEENSVLKEENTRLNNYVTSIMDELNEKAPVIQKIQENYNSAVENIASLCKQNDSLLLENKQLQDDIAEAKKSFGHHQRENERLTRELRDVSRQVCFLLQEVEEARGGIASVKDISSSFNGSANDVISKQLVTFRNVEELQSNNQKLLTLVRELSSKQEEMERDQDEMDTSSLKSVIVGLNNDLEASRDAFLQQEHMIEQLIQQRNSYRDMYLKTVKGEPVEQMQLANSNPGSLQASPVKAAANVSEVEKALEEVKKELATSEEKRKELKLEYEDYRKERKTNEQMLTDQVDTLLKQIRELTVTNSKLATQAEFQTERFKALQTNLSGQKAQITALEEKCSNYSKTIAKHELSLNQVIEEAMTAKRQLSRAEVELESLRQECNMLRESENRLRTERDSRRREASGQAMLLANLESIKATLTRTEAEGRLRLEERLDESLKERTALRRKLEDEKLEFKSLIEHIEGKLAIALAREEEERAYADVARRELTEARQDAEVKQQRIDELEASLREAIRVPPVIVHKNDDELSTRLREAESKLKASETEVSSLKQQLEVAKKHLQQYTEIAESTEKQLQEYSALHSKLKVDSETEQRLIREENDRMQTELEQLREQVNQLQAAGNQSTSALQVQASELEAQLQEVTDQLRHSEDNLATLVAELEATRREREEAVQASRLAEEKYAHEVTLHSNDIVAANRIREELAEVRAQLSDLDDRRAHAEEALAVGKSTYEQREAMAKQELEEQRERLKELEKQNALLHEQIEALGTHMAVQEAKNASPNVSANLDDSSSIEEVKGPEKLLQIVSFLRKENALAVAKHDVLVTENSTLRAEREILEKQAKENREALEKYQQREQAGFITVGRHQELLRKVETLNAVTDSNLVLREERDSLRAKEKTLVSRVEELEEEIAPLREQGQALSSQLEALRSENSVLKADLSRWRLRTNQLIERANKTSPEDWKRLQGERDVLSQQLAGERQANIKLQEEIRNLLQVRSRLEEQLTGLTRRQAAQEAELRNASENNKKLSEEVNVLRPRVSALEAELNEFKTNSAKAAEEVARLNEQMAIRDTKEKQIKNLARKYRSQFEELKAATEAERAEWEARVKNYDAQIAATQQLTPETKDQLREEGRREAEQRLKEVETSHSEQVRELSNQVTSSQEEAGSLKREIEIFKSSEERYKTVLQKTKLKINQLTEQKSHLERQLNDSRSSTRDENEARLNVLKSQYEGKIARLEKEKADTIADLSRKIEELTGKLTRLQRAMENRTPGSAKPASSSGHVDKVTTEPPTANIKPMAGPSSSSGKQPIQQAVTVSPWRAGAETPLASIKPISMQSRMAAISPCSQQSSGSTAVLLPLHQQSSPQQQQAQPQQQVQPQSQAQQQAVHTTGTGSVSNAPTTSNGASGILIEAISSSDYMPATSSASPAATPIRQVAVPPTQQSTVGPSTSRDDGSAESTQDMEVEPTPAVQQQAPQPQTPQRESTAAPTQIQQPQTPVQAPSPQAQQTPQQAQNQQQAQPAATQQSAGQQPQQAVAMVLPRERGEQSGQSQAQGKQPSAAQQAVQPGQAPQQHTHSTQTPPHSSSQLASSSNTVTTTQTTSQPTLKRARDMEGDTSSSRAVLGEGSKSSPQVKRCRVTAGTLSGDPFQAPAESSECGSLEVEYQVPTSSQRDQDDDIIVVSSEDDDEEGGDEDDEDTDGMADDGAMEEPDDGQEFQGDEDEEDNEEGFARYEMGAYDREDQDPMASYDDVEGPDIDDDNGREHETNEVEIIDDSNEVPNQPGSSSSASTGEQGDPAQLVVSSAPGEQLESGTAHVSPLQQQAVQPQQPAQAQAQPQEQQQSSSEATSSGATNQSDNGNSSGSSSNGGMNQVSSQGFGSRGRSSVPPLNRQQQLLLPQGYEDAGDDGIVPSTPTLFVPRRTDGFGEAVSSPQVPSAGRFTFSESNPPAVRAGVAQVVGEGMDDTRVDLSQLEDPGTGRSVPTTPLQVSPQGEVNLGEVGQSSGLGAEAGASTAAQHQLQEQDMPGQPEDLDIDAGVDRQEQPDEPEEVLILEEEEEDGVSSEGSKVRQPSQSQQAMDLEMEEGREAEATEATASSPQASGSAAARETSAPPGSNSHRRPRNGGNFARRGRPSQRPTPIVWNEPGAMGSTSHRPGPEMMGRGVGRGMPMLPMMGRGMPDPRGRGNPRARRGGLRRPYGQYGMPF